MKAFIKSFGYAFQGIITAIKTQRNMRIHIVAAVHITALSLFYDFAAAEYAALALTYGMVISLELVNTALENAVDICSPQFSIPAKNAKDCAAGAVLVAAVSAIAVGIFLFADFEVLKAIAYYYADNIAALAGLISSAALSVVFIAYPFKDKEKNGQKDCERKRIENGNKN